MELTSGCGSPCPPSKPPPPSPPPTKETVNATPTPLTTTLTQTLQSITSAAAYRWVTHTCSTCPANLQHFLLCLVFKDQHCRSGTLYLFLFKVWVYPVALKKAGKAVILQVNLSSSFASNAAPQKLQTTTKRAGMEFSGEFHRGYHKEN